MRKILVGFDGSGPANRALGTAADLATALGASITIVSVVPVNPRWAPTDSFDNDDVHRRELEGAAAMLAGRGIRAETVQLKGDPGRAIAALCKKDGYDTVVVGSRGRGAASRLLLGSVSTYLATHSRGIIVIVH